MQKKLSALGNSMALVIDKPIRDLLGIKRDTWLRMTTDGRRLVVEPIVVSALPSASGSDRCDRAAVGTELSDELDAMPVLNSLINTFHMTHTQFRRLHHDGWSFGAHHGWLKAGFASSANTAELATMQRLKECLRILRGGGSCEEAITAALISFPVPGRESRSPADCEGARP